MGFDRVILCTEHALRLYNIDITLKFNDLLKPRYEKIFDCYVSTIDERHHRFHCLHVLYQCAGVLRLYIRYLQQQPFTDSNPNSNQKRHQTAPKQCDVGLCSFWKSIRHQRQQLPSQCLFVRHSPYICFCVPSSASAVFSVSTNTISDATSNTSSDTSSGSLSDIETTTGAATTTAATDATAVGYIELADISSSAAFAQSKTRVALNGILRVVSVELLSTTPASPEGELKSRCTVFMLCVELANIEHFQWFVVTLRRSGDADSAIDNSLSHGQSRSQQINPSRYFSVSPGDWDDMWSQVTAVANIKNRSPTVSAPASLFLGLRSGQVQCWEAGVLTHCKDMSGFMSSSAEYLIAPVLSTTTCLAAAPTQDSQRLTTKPNANIIVKLELIYGGNLLLVFTSYGQLFLLCAFTLVIKQEFAGVGAYACVHGSRTSDASRNSNISNSNSDSDSRDACSVALALVSVEDCWKGQLTRVFNAHPTVTGHVLPLAQLRVLWEWECLSEMTSVEGQRARSIVPAVPSGIEAAAGALQSARVINVNLADVMAAAAFSAPDGSGGGDLASTQEDSSFTGAELNATTAIADTGATVSASDDNNHLKRGREEMMHEGEGTEAEAEAEANAMKQQEVKRLKPAASVAVPTSVSLPASSPHVSVMTTTGGVHGILDMLDNKIRSAQVAMKELCESVATKSVTAAQYYRMIVGAIYSLKEGVQIEQGGQGQRHEVVEAALGVNARGGGGNMGLVALFSSQFLEQQQMRHRLSGFQQFQQQRPKLGMRSGGVGIGMGMGMSRLAMRHTGAGVSTPATYASTTAGPTAGSGAGAGPGPGNNNSSAATTPAALTVVESAPKSGCIIPRGLVVLETAYVTISSPECGVMVLVYVANYSAVAAAKDIYLSCSSRINDYCGGSGSVAQVFTSVGARCSILKPQTSAVLSLFAPLDRQKALQLALQRSAVSTRTGVGRAGVEAVGSLPIFDVSTQFYQQRSSTTKATSFATINNHLFVGSVLLTPLDIADMLAPGTAPTRWEASVRNFHATRACAAVVNTNQTVPRTVAIPRSPFCSNVASLLRHWVQAHYNKYRAMNVPRAMPVNPLQSLSTADSHMPLSVWVQYCSVAACIPLSLSLSFKSLSLASSQWAAACDHATGDNVAMKRCLRRLQADVSVSLGSYLKMTILDGNGSFTRGTASCGGGVLDGSVRESVNVPATVTVVMPTASTSNADSPTPFSAATPTATAVSASLTGHSREEVATALMLLDRILPKELTIRPDNSTLIRHLTKRLARALLRELSLTTKAYCIQQQWQQQRSSRYSGGGVNPLFLLRGVPSLSNRELHFRPEDCMDGREMGISPASGKRSANFANILLANNSPFRDSSRGRGGGGGDDNGGCAVPATLGHSQTRTHSHASPQSESHYRSLSVQMLAVGKHLQLPSTPSGLVLYHQLMRAQVETDMALALLLFFSD